MDRVDVVVIGAGVVGLAVARAFARQGREVLILERENTIGTQTSSRNSEVIHAGIYYADGSNKARLCVAGKWALYDWCERAGVPHRRCGKLIVASDEAQVPVLERIRAQAMRNGVDDLQWLDAEAVAAVEPELRVVRALWSPSTGIIDSHALMLSLLGDAERHGAMLAVRSAVLGLTSHPGGLVLRLASDDGAGADPTETLLQASLVVNSAGHDAIGIARSLCAPDAADPPAWLPADWVAPEAFFTKGNYFRYTGRTPFSRLVYPVPEPGGLGIHLTLDLGGQARFGPDVEPVDRFHYPVDPVRGQRFYAAIRRYWPGLPDDSLAADYSGMRPRFRVGGEDATDFRIERLGPDGAALINLFGIESPGLTSCLAIADEVVGLA